jgi:demethylmenaquinone methyltransferase/2-methoxy-6-polyprenyl-1,4-benzoquinol methylase
MFDRIASRYDLMNRLMTFGRDDAWRRCVVRAANLSHGGRLLDAGAGTGSISLEAIRRHPGITAVASDFTLGMMQVGKTRAGGMRLRWCGADALHLPFADDAFDAVVSGYLIRNVTDPHAAIAEQVRVVKRGGRIVCLDTSPAPDNLLRPASVFFLRHVIPRMGKWITGDASAYTYLPESTQAFLSPEALTGVMRSAGLVNVQWQTFMMGNMAVHAGTKP